MKLKTITLLSALVMGLFSTACSSDESSTGGSSDSNLQVSIKDVDFPAESDSKIVTVTSNNNNWRASAQDSWCQTSIDGSKLTISVDENEGRLVRTTYVNIAAGTETAQIRIRQLGSSGDILVNPSELEFSAYGDNIPFQITTNVDYEIIYPDWLQEDPATRARPMVVYNKAAIAEKYEGTAIREDSIIVRETGNSQDNAIVRYIKVTQDGLGNYDNRYADDIKDDIKLKVVSGTASSYQPGTNIDLSYDGDTQTIYHSNWNNSGSNYFPITLTYNLESVSRVDYLIYTPRQDGSQNGRFKVVDIYYSEDGSNFQLLKSDYDFKGSGSATRITFDNSIKAQSFRFVVKSGAGDGQGFASCAEMEFYQKNDANFDYTTLFTDETCSELKAGITQAQIDACTYPFYRTIAYYMFMNSYPREFRIATFKAYPSPDIQAKQLKTAPYSLLDNPTGISVKKDEELVVFVGDTHGYNISLLVQNLDKPNGDGFGGETYPLARGVNKLKMRDKGLAYVMYHTETLDDTNATPVKIHFATGTVNGYFDTQKHSAKDWSTLLGNATDKYFDLVGKYSHCIFETSIFKQNTTSGKALADAFDKIAYEEQRLMGLVKYNKLHQNRMCLTVMYQSYMYATSYHTAYNVSTLPSLCNVDKLTTTDIWGPAHEIGHMNQTRPGLKWIGTTEVTNNIMSEYIQTTIFKQPSRLQTEDMGDGTNRYTKAWNSLMLTGTAHCNESDVFCKLVPFWQLELYFGKVLGQTPLQLSDNGGFYPEVYETIRDNADLSTNGARQLEFVYTASKCSGYDLTDFFDKWGFFTPVDVDIDDYGTGRMTVTEDMVTKLKERIAALNLTKLTAPIQYITDANWQYFKSNAAVVKGDATRSGNLITLTNWKNVVVYEVKNAAGKVVYASDGILSASSTAKFKVPNWEDTYKVYAVGADGTRTLVEF